MIASLEDVARALNESGVRFIVIGGWAGIIHGAARTTNDVDVVYDREPDNIRRLVESLKPWNPYLHGAPPGLPFRFDERTILAGLNFTLTTSHGNIDILGEVAGDGTYPKLLPESREVATLGVTVRVVTLECLIRLKRAAGRPKDFEAIAELEILLQERRSHPEGDF